MTEPVQDADAPIIQETKKWNAFRNPPLREEMAEHDFLDSMKIPAKLLTYFVTFAMVLGCAALSKGTLLFMTSQIADDVTRPVCEGPRGPYDRYEVSLKPRQKIAWIWTITFVFFVPQIVLFLKSLGVLIFKSWKKPGLTEVLSILFTESLQTVGLALLVFQILPSLNAISGAMLTNAVCLIPGILCLISRYKEEGCRRSTGPKWFLKIALDVLSIVFQVTAFIIWPFLYSGKSDNWYLILLSLVLISFGWWENYVSDDWTFTFIRNLVKSLKTSENSRCFTYSFVSIWKCILFFVCMVISPPDGVDRYAMFSDFGRAFADDYLNTTPIEIHQQLKVYGLTPVWIFLINIATSWLCYVFAKFAYDIYIHWFSCALPIILATPVTVTVLSVMGEAYVQNPCTYFGHVPVHLFYNVPREGFSKFLIEDHVWIWLLWWLSQIWITIHIWTPTSENLAPSEGLFVCPVYDPFLVDQHIALNRRRQHDKSDPKPQINPGHASSENHDALTRIYVCGTMWHETEDEMMHFLKSIMRLDEDQCARKIATQHTTNYNVSNYYELETHIFFDDAFERGPQGHPYPQMNKYVKNLIQVVREAAREVHGPVIEVTPPTKYDTPYGGRLVWTLPGNTQMIAHLKDKKKIRAKKRWSQVMYMYYLLGHKYKLMGLDLDVDAKQERARNTYILALDGDIEFQPKAMHVLVELMKRNHDLGAACGRIHPVSSYSLLVWYQMFEYGISHWLQKATEHVIGCVLCSPGCFSLFRAAALMDDCVMRKYASKSTEAMHCLQYDQGEDRWLCTLLLQRGYRVEYSAMSDSFTHCPEDFGQFYNQRRRWIISTEANMFDLLSTSEQTVKENNYISSLYLLYHFVLMIGTVLGPGMIFLILTGAFVTVLHYDPWLSLFLNSIPIVIFVLACTLSSNDRLQIKVAAVLSILYAFIMATVFIGLLLQISTYGPLNPTALFTYCVAAQMVLAALLHPKETKLLLCGPVYYVAIPSMYMLLIIYAVLNMNNVSWGTREVTNAESPTQQNKGENIPENLRAEPVQSNSEVVSGSHIQNAPDTSITEQVDWIHDPILQKSESDSISNEEETFFIGVIDKHLDPNDDKHEDKECIQQELKEMRGKAALGFFIFNAMFVNIVFLLTLSTDQIHIKWPWSVRMNFTYIDNIHEVVVYKEFLRLEPFGMLFLFGFLVILLVQFLAMLKHRFRTFSQIMSNTPISWPCFNSSKGSLINKEHEHLRNNYVSVIRQLQRGGLNNCVDKSENIQPAERKIVKVLEADLPIDVEKIIDLETAFERGVQKVKNSTIEDYHGPIPRETLMAFIANIRPAENESVVDLAGAPATSSDA